MAKKRSADDEAKQLEEIKRLVVIAMFADDLLLERRVLKGGNALDLVHRIGTRGSLDVDFSMQGAFSKDELMDIKRRIEASLVQTFAEAGLKVFDVSMEEMPEGLTADLADFWGGYYVHFKLIEPKKFDELGGEIEAIRRNALMLGTGRTKFEIDISKHEFVEQKEARDLSGYKIFVYSPAMMICEKLRAICQQMPEYGPVVKRIRPGAARARDFFGHPQSGDQL